MQDDKQPIKALNRRAFLKMAAVGVPQIVLGALATTTLDALRPDAVSHAQIDTEAGTGSLQQVQPVFKPAVKADFVFHGPVGERIVANEQQWLMVAPIANPSMLTMFRDRDAGGQPASQRLLWWSGEFAGKYLISGVQGLRISKNEYLRDLLQTFVDTLIAYQAPDGYLGPFETAARMTGKDLWDLWGQYHCMLGLYLWHRETGYVAALDAACRAADYFCDTFLNGPKKLEDAGAPAMNLSSCHVFTLLYQETGRPRYLQMIREFERAWAVTTGGYHGGNYVLGFQQGELFHWGGQPRWESLHGVQAVAELYFMTGEAGYRRSFEQIWRSIQAHDRHNTGSFSSEEQARGNPYDPRPIETCATIAWMCISIDLLRMTGDAQVADELELSTWNAVLGAQSPDGRWWTYNTPMGGIPTNGMPTQQLPPPMNDVPWFLGERIPARFDIGWQERIGAEYLSCCAANGPRGLGMLSEWAVMTANDGIVLNYYGPSTFMVRTPGGEAVILTQETDYPVGGNIRLAVTPVMPERFTLWLRIPHWSRQTRIALNGNDQSGIVSGRYLTIDRVWSPGDIVELSLDMSPHIWLGTLRPTDSRPDSLGDAQGRASIYHGPILLAYDERLGIYDPARLPPVNVYRSPTAPPAQSDLFTPLVALQYSTLQGSIVLCDFASAGNVAASPVAPIPAINTTWQFGRSDGTILGAQIQLLSDGTIVGYSHPNEVRWGFQGNTLVFYGQNNQPSTRFTWSVKENGRFILRGRSLFDSSIIHILSELSTNVTDKVWQFGRTDGAIVATRMQLLPDGSIAGYSHPNETRWGLEGGTLTFYDQSNQPSTRFTMIKSVHGRMCYEGRFDPAITHILREMDFTFTNKIWRFQSADSLPRTFRLMKGGRIDGAIYENETFWRIEGVTLVFYNQHMTPTTRFTTVKADNNGMVLEGQFLLNTDITHRLQEILHDLDWYEGTTYLSWAPVPQRVALPVIRR